jgi:hypothetical protein
MFKTIVEVNVRSSPSLSAKLQGTLAKGQSIQTVGEPVVQEGFIWRQIASDEELWLAERNEEGSWIFLQPADFELTISSAKNFVTVMDKVNVRDNPGLQAAIVGDIGKNQEVQTEGEVVTKDAFIWRKLKGERLWLAERSEDGSQVFMKALAAPPVNLPTLVFVTVMDNVNVRSGPGLDMPVLERLMMGQGIRVVGEAAIRDGYMWRRLEGVEEKWVAERKTDNSVIILRATQTANLPPLEDDEEDRPTRNVTLPPNVDIDPKDYERTFRASLAVTRVFEGGGFDSYQNFDRGVVSYGIMQFTLGSGSLGKVLAIYLNASQTPIAQALRSEYSMRVENRDANLRNDTRFRDLLKAAANEDAMQDAQYAVATTDYWEVMIRNYIQRRGNIRLPLSYALLFDMGINFGVNHPYVRLAEEALGVPPNSRPGENGITEQQLISKVAELRRDSHYRQAEKENLPGLKVRGDFWVNLTQDGDWFLRGDENGFVYPKQGARAQVRNPF